jgi:hypothetical protein
LCSVGGAPLPLDNDAGKYFLVLKLACDTGVSKLMSHSLDVIQKLLSFGYLNGGGMRDERIYPNPNPAATLAVPSATPAPGSKNVTPRQISRRIAEEVDAL